MTMQKLPKNLSTARKLAIFLCQNSTNFQQGLERKIRCQTRGKRMGKHANMATFPPSWSIVPITPPTNAFI